MSTADLNIDVQACTTSIHRSGLGSIERFDQVENLFPKVIEVNGNPNIDGHPEEMRHSVPQLCKLKTLTPRERPLFKMYS